MLFAIPKLTDDKHARRKPVWLLIYAGRNTLLREFAVEVLFGWRPDLVHPVWDRFARIPAAAAVRISWSKKGIRLQARSDVSEIARRLAGGDE